MRVEAPVEDWCCHHRPTRLAPCCQCGPGPTMVTMRERPCTRATGTRRAQTLESPPGDRPGTTLMSFVPYWSRTRLRSTWGLSLGLVLLIGVAGGTALALIAGGLRTDS